jgi:hypothetical protein
LSGYFGASADAGALRSHTARKDGRTVAILSLAPDGATVEAQVFSTSRPEAIAPGPYRFATPAEAGAFLDETLEALTYLGCEIT